MNLFQAQKSLTEARLLSKHMVGPEGLEPSTNGL